MKQKSREINIFSMSALDLFASALGAFILVTVVLFPYFPNTGDSPERVAKVKEQLKATEKKLAKSDADLKKTKKDLSKSQNDLSKSKQALAKAQSDLQKAKGQLAKAKQQQKQAKKTAIDSKVRLPHIDMVIVLDITGSMGKHIAMLRGDLEQLVGIFRRISPSVGIGVVTFGDRKYDRPVFTHDIREVTRSSANFDDLKRFIRRIKRGMGTGRGRNPDSPEAVGQGLDAAINMSWRGQSQKKYILVITDNPAYSHKINYTYSRASEFASMGNRHVATLYAQTSKRAKSSAVSYLKRLAEEGQGEFVNGGSITAALLQATLQ